MCNLSQYVEEKGIEQGEEKILALYNWLINNNRMEEATLILKQENKELRKKLYSEFDADN